jgi:undecaprenyl diphosphate synthase
MSLDKTLNKFPKLRKIPADKFPKHVLIIPDGNGRWARTKGKPTITGHQKGYRILKEVIQTLQYLPIDIVTIWGFAADNWKRSDTEIQGLMLLFERGLKELKKELIEKNSRFIHLGRKDRITTSLKKTIDELEKLTRNNTNKIICIAIDYGGDDQYLRIMQKVKKLPARTKIDHSLLEKLRDGKGRIYPADLIIRTSGEQRTSDLGWLSINSEFFSIEKYLPDTTPEDFIKGLIDYSKRERRFGGRFNASK